ncbi:hypothetical protein L2E82_44501 [Cichorium intybus]|uniref:Uncharacterized protein n=1 Tax=Cichorium intybus TaxID=13427 RepID=A0ACB8ZRE7_CICIN|nr:hypothetical protein L2E82_44501 [Cichorium intybus]
MVKHKVTIQGAESGSHQTTPHQNGKTSKEDLISLDTAATALVGDVHDPTAMRTKLRRLYGIANVFSSTDLLEKINGDLKFPYRKINYV